MISNIRLVRKLREDEYYLTSKEQDSIDVAARLARVNEMRKQEQSFSSSKRRFMRRKNIVTQFIVDDADTARD
jgi:hypothetical protein